MAKNKDDANIHADLAAQYESTRQWHRMECLKLVVQRGNFHEASEIVRDAEILFAFIEQKEAKK